MSEREECSVAHLDRPCPRITDGWFTAVVMVEGEAGEADAFREQGEAAAWADRFMAGANACGGPSMAIWILPDDQDRLTPTAEPERGKIVGAWREAVLRNRKRVGD